MATAATPATAVRVARTVAEVEALRPVFESVGTSYVDAELDVALAVIRTRPGVVRPHVTVVESRGRPAALAVGRIEELPFRVRLGYANVYRPTLRTLRVVHGGISGEIDNEIARALVRGLDEALARDEADILLVPVVRVGSALDRALEEIPAAIRRQRLVTARTHHRLVLPATFEEWLAGRDHKSRYNLTRSASRIEQAFQGRLTLDRLDRPEHYDRVVRDLERVAAKTYQRGLGVGFADTPERRALVRIGLDRGWLRAWLLAVDAEPVAFWQGTVRNGTLYANTTGYDPAYARFGVGTYVQVRMFRDVIADPHVRAVDFGWGDAEYKARFGTESWEERDIVVFAPTWRAVRANLTRTAVVAVDRSVRRHLAAIGGTARVKKAWRARLRR
jgi:Acetyltransferase (GNAT) domain